MERPADEGTVVQTVPMLRVQAVIFTLLALAVTAVLAKNPLDAVVSSVIGAIIWAAVMHFLVTRRAYNLPPVRVSPEGLPPIDSAWKWVLPHTTLVTVFYAAAVACTLFMRQYYVLGIALGGPIMLWDNVRVTKQAERKEHGVLWSTSRRFVWRPADRVRYLSVDDRHYAANLNSGNEADW